MRLHHEYLPATSATQQELVLLHGWGCNREVWRPLLVLLRPWANITLLDLPGCAPGLPGAVKNEPELAGLLAGILECCPEQAVYVGWSLGGQLAIELALHEPQRVLAVVTVCSNPRFVATGDWPGMGADVFNRLFMGFTTRCSRTKRNHICHILICPVSIEWLGALSMDAGILPNEEAQYENGKKTKDRKCAFSHEKGKSPGR